ncbi:right-handed parallel beta-helix repeat-containing protein [Sphingomonas morindae]|uniref:Right-handed parallel beta-helix repeat-containing protein n=1 Tax=Sphingomonas morindae TaxID=1541170 RepID=A0ABY4X8F9_9SPHN|nr:right-handed parallel beta-helix repeat-containing protein [Sphingomonas morindae]USI73228.1 right-handed parallel beta-helix repeat-containing protein [Sphingomonas morindae]
MSVAAALLWLQPLPAAPLSARPLYVNARGSDQADCAIPARACATVQRAMLMTQPGDVVHIAKGRYAAPIWIGRPGLPGAPITYVFDPGAQVVHPPTNDSSAFSFDILAPYIRIFNGEFIGTLGSISYEEARANYRLEKASGVQPTHKRFTQYCLVIHASHVMVANNYVHDCAGAGIYAQDVDDVEINGNRVERTGWWSMQDPSAIVFHYGLTAPGVAARGVRIINNVVRDSANTIPFWMDALDARPTDGNGIIIDLAQGHQADYAGPVLIKGNQVQRSGGSGIRAYHSENVAMIGNTVSGSHRCPVPEADCGAENGELNFNASTGSAQGNVAVADGGNRALFVYRGKVRLGANMLIGLVEIR